MQKSISSRLLFSSAFFLIPLACYISGYFYYHFLPKWSIFKLQAQVLAVEIDSALGWLRKTNPSFGLVDG